MAAAIAPLKFFRANDSLALPQRVIVIGDARFADFELRRAKCDII